MSTMALFMFLASILCSNAEMVPANHAWVIGAPPNCYGLVEWDDHDAVDGVKLGKRTQIWYGGDYFVLRWSIYAVAAVGVLLVAPLIVFPLSLFTNRRREPATSSK